MRTRNTIYTQTMQSANTLSRVNEPSGELICRPCGVIIRAGLQVSTSGELIGRAQTDGALRAAIDERWLSSRRVLSRAIVRRGIERGELRPDLSGGQGAGKGVPKRLVSGTEGVRCADLLRPIAHTAKAAKTGKSEPHGAAIAAFGPIGWTWRAPRRRKEFSAKGGRASDGLLRRKPSLRMNSATPPSPVHVLPGTTLL
jgi:hypothetical protein